ncbi:MAG: NUDIX domain-containing protein [Candidatus Aenigmatarchaeota archaeon]
MDYSGRPGVGVCVLIYKEGKILLGKRHDDPVKADSELQGAGKWTVPGGKLDFGEDIIEGAKREAKEECDIDVHDTELVSLTNDIKGERHFITVGFLAKEFSGEPKTMEPDEITEWRWFPVDQLPQPIFFPAEKAIKNFLAGEQMKY